MRENLACVALLFRGSRWKTTSFQGSARRCRCTLGASSLQPLIFTLDQETSPTIPRKMPLHCNFARLARHLDEERSLSSPARPPARSPASATQRSCLRAHAALSRGLHPVHLIEMCTDLVDALSEVDALTNCPLVLYSGLSSSSDARSGSPCRKRHPSC